MEINRINSTTNMDNYMNLNNKILDNPVNYHATTIEAKMEDKQENEKEQKYFDSDLKDAKEILDRVLNKTNSHLEYERHDKFKNVMMIKIVNNDTGEVIKEMPPKKILDMVAAMCKLVGILIDEKA